MKDVVILGAGGSARDTADIINACNKYNKEFNLIGFIDENKLNHGIILNGVPILGDLSWFVNQDLQSIYAVAAIGNPISKKRIVEKANIIGVHFCNIIHPSVIDTPFVTIGKGIVMAAGCILTNRITIYDHVFLNVGCTVGHDTIIKEYCNVNPGAHISGNVTLEQGCDIGAGAVIIQGKNIGSWSTVGAGAVVISDILEHKTVVGVPGKAINK